MEGSVPRFQSSDAARKKGFCVSPKIVTETLLTLTVKQTADR